MKEKDKKPYVVCKETIIDLQIQTNESGWFSIDKKIKCCPYCGRKIK